ncbi:alpha/beta fold hydrolase [Sphingobium phenoxybenzoativorans]|uniref:Alpha/beta fold hydrolase n=2 Tax=Sphingobium phenoxybenzoativorans TaxID=1592790 RepID=A0A975Q3T0_9SPHN|nr:alpha/beta fold hydrolase [Sphingobium phenoxybenzoativorans]QUT08229.1 alpha/beta fold hydrolase [Sphingobium phenoxybenzoativorans]
MMPGHRAAPLAVHQLGAGRPLILLHGLFSNAHVNWIKYGTAAAIAERGFRVIMPDFRVHGQSSASHDLDDYPADVLALDVEALISGLGLSDYDLGGFSLGARTTALLLTRGLAPRRAILAGMGLQGLSGWAKRRDFFLSVIADRDTIKHGDPRWLSAQFMKTMKVDGEAAALLLRTFGDIDPADLPGIATPILVVSGAEDRDNGSPQDLTDILPNARLEEIPGTHMSSVTKPELGRVIGDFLAA